MIPFKVLLPIFILISILLYRALIVFQPDKAIFEPCSPTHDNHSLLFDAQRLKAFQTLLQFQTISYEEFEQNYTEIVKCREFIKVHYENIVKKHSKYVKLIDVNDYSLLYTIQGKNAKLKPFLLSAHLDVVPAKYPDRWTHPPFAGVADDEFIYGRGTLDDKGTVFNILEAVQEYLNVYGQPARTFYVGITHDEEVGRAGAMSVAEYLSKQPFGQNGEFEFVLDEGTIIMEEAFPGLKSPVAIIAVAEKGYMSVEYRVDIAPGHSSIASTPTAIGILARGMDRLESTNQPSRFGYGPEMGLFHGVTPYLSFPLRLAMSNIWLFGPVIQWILAQKPGTNAIQRTTTAITLIEGGEKENILPATASATINHRIHTADTCASVLENNRRIINDARIVARIKRCNEPSPISPFGKDIYAYRILEETVRQTFHKDRSGIIVVPGLMLGATDSRSYTNLSKNLYRYSPYVYHHEDLNRLHGNNERIRHSDMQRGLNFYFHLIVNNQLESLPEENVKNEL